MQTTETFTVYQAKGRQVFLLFLDSLLVLLNLFVIYLGWLGESLSYCIVGGCGTVLFVVWGGLLMRYFFKGKILVQLTTEGFYDYSSLAATGQLLIRWEDVSDIQEITFGGQTFVSVKLVNEADYLAHLSAYKRWLGQANTKLTGTPVNLVLQTARFMTAGELLERMTADWKQAVGSPEKDGFAESKDE